MKGGITVKAFSRKLHISSFSQFPAPSGIVKIVLHPAENTFKCRQFPHESGKEVSYADRSEIVRVFNESGGGRGSKKNENNVKFSHIFF